MEKKRVNLAEMLPIIEETLAAGGTVKLPITGTSMLPLLRRGRDTVTLTAVTSPLKKYDLPLYRRKDGAFVLHRVVKVQADGTYTMCGDNQWVQEPNIHEEQCIGVVCAITRNGKTVSVRNTTYKLYTRVWHLLLPVRKYFVKLRGKLSK